MTLNSFPLSATDGHKGCVPQTHIATYLQGRRTTTRPRLQWINWKSIGLFPALRHDEIRLLSGRTTILTQKIILFRFLFVSLHPQNKKDRDLAQLVAYYVRDVGVAGSSPVIPTYPRRQAYIRLVSFAFYGLRIFSFRSVKMQILSHSYSEFVLTAW